VQKKSVEAQRAGNSSAQANGLGVGVREFLAACRAALLAAWISERAFQAASRFGNAILWDWQRIERCKISVSPIRNPQWG
jgi:hypothetical protein